jgi:hypothetical protein
MAHLARDIEKLCLVRLAECPNWHAGNILPHTVIIQFEPIEICPAPRPPTSPTMDNSTTLTNLQSEKDLLERDAARLRQSLHELHQAGRELKLTAHVWQSEFACQHEKLVIVASKIGVLDKRILALVEGEGEPIQRTRRGSGVTKTGT